MPREIIVKTYTCERDADGHRTPVRADVAFLLHIPEDTTLEHIAEQLRVAYVNAVTRREVHTPKQGELPL